MDVLCIPISATRILFIIPGSLGLVSHIGMIMFTVNGVSYQQTI